MAARARKSARHKSRKPTGPRRTAAPPRPSGKDRPGDDLAAELRAVAERLTACEQRQEATLAAIAAATDALHNRADDTQASIDDLQAAVEPLRMAAAGTASPDDIARRIDYLGLVSRIRRIVRDRVPRQARVLVIGRGDEELLRLFGRKAGQFPQDALGDFAGEYPIDGKTAVAALEGLLSAGWDHLVIPATSAWWLDYYRDFRIHLHRGWHAVHRDADTCSIFAFDPTRPGPWHGLDSFIAEFRQTESRLPAILDWETGSDLAGYFPGCAVFPPVDRGAESLPYLDRSVDIVAVPWGDIARRSEARRLATAAVVEIAVPGLAGPGFRLAVEPLGRHAQANPSPAASDRLGLITPASRP